MQIFDTETLARELGAAPETEFKIAQAFFDANPGNHFIALETGSKSEDGLEPEEEEKTFRLYLVSSQPFATDPDA